MVNPVQPGQESDAAWRQLLSEHVRTHGRMCFAIAWRILGHAGQAEDACQQAFLKAWEHRRRIQREGSLRAWLVRVVTTESLQMARRRRTERRVLDVTKGLPADDGAAGSVDPGATDPLRGLALRESVVRALEELPVTTRSVVILRIMAGYSGNEVKEILGCSASEVSRRYHEGMAMLRVALSEWSEPAASGSPKPSGSIAPGERDAPIDEGQMP